MTTKQLREIIAFARDLGVVDARVEQRGRHPHLLGTAPNGTALRYVLPGTPSDGRRGERNTKADLRRACRSVAAVDEGPRAAGRSTSPSATTQRPGTGPCSATKREGEEHGYAREQRARDRAYVAHVEDACERGDPDELRAALNELPNPEEREAALVLAALCGLLDEDDKKVGG
jgi:hypothetical protein